MAVGAGGGRRRCGQRTRVDVAAPASRTGVCPPRAAERGAHRSRSDGRKSASIGLRGHPETARRERLGGQHRVDGFGGCDRPGDAPAVFRVGRLRRRGRDALRRVCRSGRGLFRVPRGAPRGRIRGGGVGVGVRGSRGAKRVESPSAPATQASRRCDGSGCDSVGLRIAIRRVQGHAFRRGSDPSLAASRNDRCGSAAGTRRRWGEWRHVRRRPPHRDLAARTDARRSRPISCGAQASRTPAPRNRSRSWRREYDPTRQPDDPFLAPDRRSTSARRCYPSQ